MLTDFSASPLCQDETTTLSMMAPTQQELDAELVARLLRGDSRAWRELHERFDRLIYRCITKVTGRFQALGPEDVREIYATLFLQLVSNDMHKLRSFDPSRGNRLGTWLGMLAMHTAYDYLRSMRREANRAPMIEVEGLSSELPDPFEECVRNQRFRLVAEALADFSEKDRELVSLYFDEGLEPDEVAARMGISVKTVYSKKHKIQTRLETMLSRPHLAA